MAAPKKSAILIVGGKITLEDKSSKAWENYLHIFEVLTKGAKTKTITVLFESPDIVRGLLDAVPRDYLEKKYKVTILEGRVDVPLKLAREMLALAKGFDIAVRFDAIDMIFFHTGKLEVLSELQVTTRISALLQKMFPKIRVK
jgi:hypothetical protein